MMMVQPTILDQEQRAKLDVHGLLSQHAQETAGPADLQGGTGSPQSRRVQCLLVVFTLLSHPLSHKGRLVGLPLLLLKNSACRQGYYAPFK